MLEGVTVCGGVAIGKVKLRGYELDRSRNRRLAASQAEPEVERFLAAVSRSKAQVERLKASVEEDLGKEEVKILGVHLAYLQDPTFLADVEERIRRHLLPLEDALAAVVRDFDRIFELVENEKLKECALDLRDVALRVLRNLEPVEEGEGDDEADEDPYILVSRKLSITDMQHLDRSKVLGIVAESGGPNSHAAILARSMGIPAITGVQGLRDRLKDGDFVILDAGTGVLYLDPEERLRREYEVRVLEAREAVSFEDEGPDELGDGTPISLMGSCGNLGDVGQAMDAGLEGVGLYRTELLFFVDRTLPGEDMLLHHYKEVRSRAGGLPVTFRLLDLSGDMVLPGYPRRNEPNPALGLKGIRLLLRESTLFRMQLRALLRLASEEPIEIAVPFVTTVQELQRVRTAVREEREILRKSGIDCAGETRIGVVVEVPATAFSIEALLHEADFVIVALDDLQQYLLAADRDNLHVSEYYRTFHPALFRLLDRLHRETRRFGKECRLFGEGAADPLRLPFFLGVGFRSFSVSPVRSPRIRKALRKWTAPAAESLSREVLAAPSSLEVQRLLLRAER